MFTSYWKRTKSGRTSNSKQGSFSEGKEFTEGKALLKFTKLILLR